MKQETEERYYYKQANSFHGPIRGEWSVYDREIDTCIASVYDYEDGQLVCNALNAQSGITISRECADLASSLFTEVILVHADPTDAEYSECENPESRCMWCVDAMKIIEALESK